eukprot:TRINITY_DN25060_c0_g1_i1.p1 TRINITY_DN25060_c0_g1~~TRINITY_DN25060_c0_g1_i1.p1  ORF type:complete len:340 (-),score=33.81 TRINITY_DN25060_c0_g1_i1:46-1065(-)
MLSRFYCYKSKPNVVVNKRAFSRSRAAMDTLVIAEHDNKHLNNSTLHAISCAQKIGKPVDVLVLGHQAEKVLASAAAVAGVRHVYSSDHPNFKNPTAEDQTAGVQQFLAGQAYTHVLTPATSTGKNFLPRLGAVLDVQPISEIQAVVSEDTFVRPIYAGNAFQTVQSTDKLKLITVRSTSFPAAPSGGAAKITSVTPNLPAQQTTWVGTESHTSERPELTSADRVVSGGRALGSAENFKILDQLADTIKAAVGASRAAVDAGYAPNDLQVGQTGKVVAPNLYVAVGISGAIQHLAGMKDSKVIVAVNKDPDAPIFQVADYGLVGDLFTVVPELTKALTK